MNDSGSDKKLSDNDCPQREWLQKVNTNDFRMNSGTNEKGLLAEVNDKSSETDYLKWKGKRNSKSRVQWSLEANQECFENDHGNEWDTIRKWYIRRNGKFFKRITINECKRVPKWFV